MGVQGLNWYRFCCDACDDHSRPVCAPTVAEAERLFNNTIEQPWLIELAADPQRVLRVLCPSHRERLGSRAFDQVLDTHAEAFAQLKDIEETESEG